MDLGIITIIVTTMGGLTAVLLKLSTFIRAHFDLVIDSNKEAFNAITEKATIEKERRVDAEGRLKTCHAKVKELTKRLQEIEE